MRRLQIKHVTTYQYSESVTLLPHKLLLRPEKGTTYVSNQLS